MPISSVAYFRACLALPLGVPLLAWVLLPKDVSLVLMMSLVFGGLPYLPFAVYLAWRFGRSPLTVQQRVWLAPLQFLPVGALAWMVFAMSGDRDASSPLTALMVFLPFALWILVMGYAYVALSIGLHAVLRAVGVVRD